VLKSREHLKSGTVVDAEGCASTLLKQVGLQTFDRPLAVSAINGEVVHADSLEEDTVEVYFGQRYAPGLYAWMIPKRDGSAKVGLATRTGNAKEHLRFLLSSHPIASKKIRFSDVKNLSYHLIPLGGPIRKTYHNGFLAVGDVASQVKPTTGGGVVMGLTCARIAGETVAQALQQRDFSSSFLSRYQNRWKQAIGFDMNAMRQIRLMLNRVSDTRFDSIIRLCSQLHVDEKLQGLGDIDFQGKAVLQLLKSPGAWTIMMYSLLSSIFS
jgi:flavin-dependent dehydrogenase